MINLCLGDIFRLHIVAFGIELFIDLKNEICHSERSEESCSYSRKKILHFVQNDIITECLNWKIVLQEVDYENSLTFC
jgi:hypothetical protein